MAGSASLDERINSLVGEINEELRTELGHALQTLRVAHNPLGVLLTMSRLSLRLIEEILGRAGHKRPSDNLYDCIVTAARGDPEKKIKGLRILPDEIASYFHTLRTLSNKVDHRAERITLASTDAENALSLFLRVLEWFYSESEQGPRLSTIYSKGANGAISLSPEPPETYEHKPPQSIQEILNERARLEKLLKEQFSKPVTVMFTDIKDATAFFEIHGDLAGREMINHHHSLLFPIVERYGKIVKTIGDAIMAYFDNPEAAVRAAIEMQKVLQEYNRQIINKTQEIHIRIGINSGIGIVEKKEDGSMDVYGDVVNTAARVESGDGKKADQILISQAVYEAIRNSEEILCRYEGLLSAKGKAEPLPLYRVVWDPELEEVLIDTTTRSSARDRITSPASSDQNPVLSCMLIAAREGNQLNITAYEKIEGDYKTVQQQEVCTITDAKLTTLSQGVVNILAEATSGGRVSKDRLIRLRIAGRSLYDELITPEAKKLLHGTRAESLILIVDDQLVSIPWELIYDGERFFCQKFNMGRMVRTKQTVSNIKVRKVDKPVKMLILADPKNDLPAAHQEGLKIRDAIEKEDKEGMLISAHLEVSNLKAADILKKVQNFDVIHYAGHADYDDTNPGNSGWLMRDDKLRASSIIEIGKEHPLPSLVFANSCVSGQTKAWKVGPESEERIFGMASAFLLAGVQHYIGTFWEVLDQPSSDFALKFYQELLKGKPIGEVIRDARMSLIEKYGEETIVWASYILYGNPGFRYLNLAQEKTSINSSLSVASGQVSDRVDHQERVVDHGSWTPVLNPEEPIALKIWSKKATGAFILSAFALILLLLGAYKLWFSPQSIAPWQSTQKKESALYEQAYSKLRSFNLEEAQALFETLANQGKEDAVLGYEGLATIQYEKKNYDKALEFVDKTLEKSPENSYVRVIKGHILLERGEVDHAVQMYSQAIQPGKGTPWQLAIAHNKLGRILSAQEKPDEALKQYDQAISLDPSYPEAYSNKGVLLGKLNRTEEALSAYRRAVDLNPQDILAQTLLRDMQHRQDEAADQARQKRIDTLIEDLAQRYREGKFISSENQEEADIWTSKPIILSLTPFEVKGTISVRDGEDEFFTIQLTDFLRETGRVVVVERQILDNLLQELKLGSSQLADQTTALKLGKLLGARFITTGSITRRANTSIAQLRLVETETTTIQGAFSQNLNLEAPSNEPVKMLAQKILEKIKKAYPLRGLIVSIKDETDLVINIGAKQGVAPGTLMNVIKDGAPIPSGDKILGYEKEDVGFVEITSVEDAFSHGKVLKSTKEIEKGMKVEEASR
jgi:class 3 adenylate cyclase/CHAT domain-containing protein/Tfp pilus assembly protein PilF